MSYLWAALEGVAIGAPILAVCLCIPRIFDGEWWIP